MNYYEEIKRELVNGARFADSYDEFVSKMLTCIMETLNNSEAGQELMQTAVDDAIRNNLTPDQWQQRKANILQVLFFLALNNCPLLKKEMAHHLYKELRNSD